MMPVGEREGGRPDWREVDRAFEEALDRPPEEWEAFLAGRCAGRPGLRREVEALLEAETAADRWIERSEEAIQEVAREAFSDLPQGAPAGEERAGVTAEPRSILRDPMRGRHVGPWRIFRRLGRGGMGTVYLAERADGQYEQRAALKILRRGLDTDDILRRFLAERQILATLTHPNIARLLDGGATEGGRPYLVLEYVEGESITDYCEARSLGVEARLRLFLTVCRAVRHAHRNLVLHRDLKPSNILVTGDGEVKLLDFGIAKLLDDSGEAAGLPGGAGAPPRTRTGMRLLTPEYASPEQVRGEPVSTATDVYQLGMLLYELLAGERPYELRGRSSVTVERVVCEEEPAPPSQRLRRGCKETEGDRLGRRLRGDLDAVCLQALRKEPERRYASVGELAEDVERHLAGRPVRARGDGRLYRLRKLVRRRRWPLAAGASILVLGFGYVAMAAAQAARLEAERDRARVEAAKAEEVKAFLVSLFDASDHAVTGGEDLTARELLEEGARRLRQELATQPEVRAEMLFALADVYERLALPERALSLAREALEIRRAESPEGSPEVAASLRQVALLANRLGPGESVERAMLGQKGPELLRTATQATREALGSGHPAYAEALHHWAIYGNHPPERRIVLEDSAIAILRAAGKTERPRLADVLAEAAHGSEHERARALAEEALELRRELFGDRSLQVATSLSDLALIVEPIDADSSERLLRRALEIHQAAAGPRHPTTLTIHNNLAGVLRDLGEYEEALALYRQVLAIRRAEGHNQVAQAYAHHGIGVNLLGLGRLEEAESYLRQSMEAFPPDDYRHNASRMYLAQALAGLGRAAEAERLLLGALETIADGGSGPEEGIRALLTDLQAN